MSVDLLTDADPCNDWESFEQMADIFQMADEDIHATAASSALGPVIKDGHDSEETNGRAKLEGVGDGDRVLEIIALVDNEDKAQNL